MEVRRVGGRLAIACLSAVTVTVAATRVSWAQASPTRTTPPTLESLQRTLDEQRALIARQTDAIEAQRTLLETLRQQLEEARAATLVVSNQLAELRREPQAANIVQTLEARLDAVERVVQRLPELPQNLVRGGDFPGSITIPGTDAAFRLGGELRFTAVHTLGPLGEDDRFITASIPVGDERAGDASRTVYTATPSRLNFDLRSPAPFGALRTFVEADFAGASHTLRLRHAYMQTNSWLFGQTWSTFDDPEAQPTEIDFEGLNAISRFRQAQIRYSRDLRDRFNLALAAENPAPDLTGASGVNLTPDFIARLRWRLGRDAAHPPGAAPHLHVAVIARSLRGQLADVSPGEPARTLHTGGFGINISGVLVAPWDADDRIRFGTNDGWGIGRYVKDLEAEGGQDAIYDPDALELQALPAASVYVAYERAWRPRLSSTVTFGAVAVDNLDIQPDGALRATRRVTLNVVWNPMPRADLVLEFLTGTRTNKDRQHASSAQLQGGWRVRF
jgi:hypothetical protein